MTKLIILVLVLARHGFGPSGDAPRVFLWLDRPAFTLAWPGPALASTRHPSAFLRGLVLAADQVAASIRPRPARALLSSHSLF